MRSMLRSALTALLFTAAAAVVLPVAAQSTAPPATPATYGAGGAKPICANCHEDKWNSIALTAHGARSDAQGSMCQACHGDATDHLKDPTKFKPENPFQKGNPAAQKAAVCLTCHSGNRNLAFWTAGKHAQNDVSCNNCHNIHGNPQVPVASRFTTTSLPNQADICSTCHQDIRTAIRKPSHHPIEEGKVKCTDCHNPHGALSPSMVKQASINEQCYSCHADKRGPFVFSHPPVEENCTTCHTPHGSSHYKLLNEHTPNLCQDCHDSSRHPGTVYGAAGGWVTPGTSAPNPSVNTRLIARACLNCHNAIHGSNAPGPRGQFFTR